VPTAQRPHRQNKTTELFFFILLAVHCFGFGQKYFSFSRTSLQKYADAAKRRNQSKAWRPHNKTLATSGHFPSLFAAGRFAWLRQLVRAAKKCTFINK